MIREKYKRAVAVARLLFNSVRFYLRAEPDRPDGDAPAALPVARARTVAMPSMRRCAIAPAGTIVAMCTRRRAMIMTMRARRRAMMALILHLFDEV